MAKEPERPLNVDTLAVGPLEANCYIVTDKASDEAMIIDPGGDADLILETFSAMDADPLYIVLTHGHADHLQAASEIKKRFEDIQIFVHEADAEMLVDAEKNGSALFGFSILAPSADQLLKDGNEILLGESRFGIIHTPGHTRGGISIYWAGTDLLAGMVFTGDALFAGGIGRYDLPGGDEQTLLTAIREKLLTLPDDTLILPGHGPTTTVLREKQTNPYFEES